MLRVGTKSDGIPVLTPDRSGARKRTPGSSGADRRPPRNAPTTIAGRRTRWRADAAIWSGRPPGTKRGDRRAGGQPQRPNRAGHRAPAVPPEYPRSRHRPLYFALGERPPPARHRATALTSLPIARAEPLGMAGTAAWPPGGSNRPMAKRDQMQYEILRRLAERRRYGSHLSIARGRPSRLPDSILRRNHLCASGEHHVCRRDRQGRTRGYRSATTNQVHNSMTRWLTSIDQPHIHDRSAAGSRNPAALPSAGYTCGRKD